MTNRRVQHATSEQLTLLPVSELPVQFRLDQRTRQRGLAHVAAIRRQLAAKTNALPAGKPPADRTGLDVQQHRAA